MAYEALKGPISPPYKALKRPDKAPQLLTHHWLLPRRTRTLIVPTWGTQEACQALGNRFQPMVRKTALAWATEAVDDAQLIRKAAAAHTGADLGETIARCAASIRQPNARAHTNARAC